MNRVLVVNDSRFERIILNDILSQLGYNVVNADEYEAVNKVQSFSPDIVLLNYIMRDTSGDKLAETIKTQKPEIKCLLTSSNQIGPDDINTSKIDAVLKTPVTKYMLETAIHRLEEQTSESSVHNIRARLERWKLKTSVAEAPVEAERAERPEAVFCPQCGSKLGTGDRSFQFCPWCGSKI